MRRRTQISNRGYFFTIFETILHMKFHSWAMHAILPLLSLYLYPPSLTRHSKHSSFLCWTPKANTPSPNFCPARTLDSRNNPWPKITLENDTQRKRRRLTFICDTIRKSSPPPSFKRVFSRSSRWIQILARLDAVA